MNYLTINNLANMTHFVHEVLEPFSVLPHPYMQDKVLKANDCLSGEQVLTKIGFTSPYPLTAAQTMASTFVLLHLLIKLPFSCLDSSDNGTYLGEIQKFASQNDSVFEHSQYEEILERLKAFKIQEEHDEHGEEKHGNDEHGHGNETHGNETHDHEDHDDDHDDHKLCLETLWPKGKEFVSLEESKDILYNLTIHLKEGTFYCDDKAVKATFFLESIQKSFLNSTKLDSSSIAALLKKLKGDEEESELTHNEAEHKEDNHDGHNHRRRRRSAHETHSGHDHDQDHGEEESLPGCYSANQILSKFNIPTDKIEESQFYRLCPALIQQAVTGVCVPKKATTPPPTEKSLSEIYGYGFLATLIVTLISLIGILVVPLMGKSFFQSVISSLICLAIGTMLGDSLLHLIPISLGLHSHESHEADHDAHAEKDINFVWKMLLLLVAIYAFYVVESVFCIIANYYHGDKVDHGHAHGHSHAHTKSQKKEGIDNGGFEAKEPTMALRADSETHLATFKSLEANTTICGIPSVSALVMFGDFVHNFVDGVAIAVGFSASLTVGWTTSLAVLLHELPHEFGDFAVFVASGMSYKRALLLNLISALSAFVGFFLGVQVATEDNVRNWLMAITAGMFIYVSLVNMLPSVMHNGVTVKEFLLQNLGIWIGVIIMLLVAIYEEDLHGH